MSSDESPPKLPLVWRWLAPALVALGVILLVGEAWTNRDIQFFPPGRAAWIVYDSPLETHGLAAQELPAEFRSKVALNRQPTHATLEFRCFRRGEILINGQRVMEEDGNDWKKVARVEVANWLRAGTNEIVATVWAASGPPALALRLSVDEVTLVTDERWEVSLAGAVTRHAVRANVAGHMEAGNSLFGMERTGAASKSVAGVEACFLVAAGLTLFLLRRLSERRMVVAAAVVGGGWLALLAHNIPLLVHAHGFDAFAHLDYIKFVQSNGAIPRADQGWEAYQAPLYYLVSAGLLGLTHCAAAAAEGMRALRWFNVVVGLANVGLVWAGLRMIFPGKWKETLAGTALAAFVPWHLCLLHFTSNEVLAATLGTASLCLCLKCLRANRESIGWHAALGVALGAACLTKASAVVVLTVIVGTLTAQWWTRAERTWQEWLQTVGVVASLAAVISGWHYARLWVSFGSPFAGNWTPGVAAPWWQRPGYTTSSYFLCFGRALTSPFFSGYQSFWDGLYSTLWGDGLWGGGQTTALRPPWNYNFMAAGYALALAPTFLIVTGGGIATVRFVREPRADWMLLLGTAAAFLGAIAFMTLKLPFYGQAKAFYALAALLPVAALAILGGEFWKKRSKFVYLTALAVSGVWFLNNFAALWVRADAPQTRLLVALKKYYASEDAAPDLRAILATDSGNGDALDYLAGAELAAGRTNQFDAVIDSAMKSGRATGIILAYAAQRLSSQGHVEEALQAARAAAHGAPDNGTVAEVWLSLARAAARPEEVVEAGEWALRDDPYKAQTHAAVALALMKLGRTNEAALHEAILHISQ